MPLGGNYFVDAIDFSSPFEFILIGYSIFFATSAGAGLILFLVVLSIFTAAIFSMY